MRHNLPQLPTRNIPLNHHHPIIILQRRRNQRPRLVQREPARIPSTRRRRLDEGQSAARAVDGEGDERVRRQGGGVGGVEVGDGEGVFAAGGDDEEALVGLGGMCQRRTGKEAVPLEVSGEGADLPIRRSPLPSFPSAHSRPVRVC